MLVKTQNLIAIVLLFFCYTSGQSQVVIALNNQGSTNKLYGYAAEQYKIGAIVQQDSLDNQDTFDKNWLVQFSQADLKLPRYARIEDGLLQVQDPRGCTIWNKSKLEGPIMISYWVTAPSSYNEENDIVPRDINQFWMANTLEDLDPNAPGGLFDSKKYNGEFKSYDQLKGYYASTGGGTVTKNNRTTRLRRYPRQQKEKLINHVALCSRDDNKDFLIVPNQRHHIQLVAANDIVQYIFDGKIVYELKKGDAIDIRNDAQKEDKIAEGIWGTGLWTTYNSGYFGFRMTRTHHVYSDFEVFRLNKK